MSAPGGPLGALGNLPKEIRDMIYGFVLAAGSTSITRASKYLYADTKEPLLQHGVYRIRVAYHRAMFQYCFHISQPPPNECLATIQNFEIQSQFYRNCGDHCDDHCVKHSGLFSRRGSPSLYTILSNLTRPVERHKRCYIKFAFSPFLRRLTYGSKTPTVIDFLRKFEAVNVELVCIKWPVSESRDDVVGAIRSLLGPNLTIVLTHIVEAPNHNFVSVFSSTL